MSGILCFKNFMTDELFSPSASDQSSSGSADTDHPASNLIDGDMTTYFRRTGASTVILRNFVQSDNKRGLCVMGLLGVQALSSGTGAPLRVLVRLQVGTAAGLGDIFDGYRRIVPNNSVFEILAPENAFFVIDPMALTSDYASTAKVAIGGIVQTTGFYIQWTLTASGSADWIVHEATAWTGLAARVRPTRIWGGSDPSVLQRAYGGAEFANRRTPKRTCSVTFTDLDDKQMRGGTRGAIPASGSDINPVVTANLCAVNFYAGNASPCVYVPNSTLGYSGYTSTADSTGRDWNIDLIAQAEIIYGFLSNPLQGREISRIDSDESIWETDFTITDAFNGLT